MKRTNRLKRSVIIFVAILTTFLITTMTLQTLAAAPTGLLAAQGFEGSGSWNFTANPAPYNVNSDTWDAVGSVGSLTELAEGAAFWGMRDLNNPNGGGNFDHVLTFDPINVSAAMDVAVTFQYNAIAYDGPDYLGYEIFVDGVGGGFVEIVRGASTDGWETERIFVPNGTNTVSMTLSARQDGGTDYAGWDDVQLNSDVENVTPPDVVDTVPVDGSTFIPVDTNLTINFTENITLTGAITVTDGTNTVATTSLGGTDNVATLLFDPTSDLSISTLYTVTMPADAVIDAEGLSLTSDYQFSFQTASDETCNAGLIVNEIDSDTPDSDTMEFVELFDGGIGNVSLDGCVVVFMNGNDDASYAAFDLDGHSTDAFGYFVLGNPDVPSADLTFGTNGLQNGADAVVIYSGNDADFPNDTPVTVFKKVSVIVYGNGQADDTGLLTGLGETTQYNEDALDDKVNDSIQRVQPTGEVPPRDDDQTYAVGTPTPDATNTAVPTAIALVSAMASNVSFSVILIASFMLMTTTIWLRRRNA